MTDGLSAPERRVVLSYPSQVHVHADGEGNVVRIVILPEAGSPGGAPAFVWDTVGYDVDDPDDSQVVAAIARAVDSSAWPLLATLPADIVWEG